MWLSVRVVGMPLLGLLSVPLLTILLGWWEETDSAAVAAVPSDRWEESFKTAKSFLGEAEQTEAPVVPNVSMGFPSGLTPIVTVIPSLAASIATLARLDMDASSMVTALISDGMTLIFL